MGSNSFIALVENVSLLLAMVFVFDVSYAHRLNLNAKYRPYAVGLGRWTVRFTLQMVSVLLIVLREPSRRHAYRFGSSVQAVDKGYHRRCLRRLGALPSCTFSIFGFTNYVCCRVGAFRSQLPLSLVQA
jgi:hypothetical protein